MDILPEPLVQLCNVRFPTSTRQSSCLAHTGLEQWQLCLHTRLNIQNKSQLMPCFRNCMVHYLITFDKLHRTNLFRRGYKREGCRLFQCRVFAITQEGWCVFCASPRTDRWRLSFWKRLECSVVVVQTVLIVMPDIVFLKRIYPKCLFKV